ncbi:unnamed protein product [Moneuplotes crassus]|uniref:Uncharacterized protein n=1 Tax=Euplotes crassus TaxID=5936 RepID=A0AAD1XVJ9_EUPCR|nr:unnamed protein product [Moneuplotes crassus]
MAAILEPHVCDDVEKCDKMICMPCDHFIKHSSVLIEGKAHFCPICMNFPWGKPQCKEIKYVVSEDIELLSQNFPEFQDELDVIFNTQPYNFKQDQKKDSKNFSEEFYPSSKDFGTEKCIPGILVPFSKNQINKNFEDLCKIKRKRRFKEVDPMAYMIEDFEIVKKDFYECEHNVTLYKEKSVFLRSNIQFLRNKKSATKNVFCAIDSEFANDAVKECKVELSKLLQQFKDMKVTQK